MSKDPVTGIEYNYILIIIEHLIKYIILVPFLTNAIAETLVHVFIQEVALRYSILEEIVLDRDKLFTSKF